MTEPRNGTRYISWAVVVSVLLALVGLLGKWVIETNDRRHTFHEEEIKTLRISIDAIARRQVQAIAEREGQYNQINRRLDELEKRR